MAAIYKFFIHPDKIKVKMEHIKNILKYEKPQCQRNISEERLSVMEEKIKEHLNPVTPIYFCKLNRKRFVIDGQHRLEVYKKLKELHNEKICIVQIKVDNEQDIENYFQLINDQLPLPDVYRMREDIRNIILKTYDYFTKKYPKSFHNKQKHKKANRPYMWDHVFMSQLTEIVSEDSEYDVMNKFDVKNSQDLIELLENLNKKYSEQDLEFFKCSPKTIERIKKGKMTYFGLFNKNWMDGITNFEDLEPQKPMTNALRFACWNKYIGKDIGKAKCWCCNNLDIWQQQFEAGHVRARNKGGKNVVTNLRPICSKCNREMSDTHMGNFMKKMGYPLK
jgi:hypothetical protein